jgi:hypothetical protein
VPSPVAILDETTGNRETCSRFERLGTGHDVKRLGKRVRDHEEIQSLVETMQGRTVRDSLIDPAGKPIYPFFVTFKRRAT